MAQIDMPRQQTETGFGGIASLAPLWIAGTLLALAASVIVATFLVSSATSASLSTISVSLLRGALPLDGLSQSAVHGAQVSQIPTHPLRTALVFLHIIGLTIGMGAVLFLDLFLVSRLYHRRVDRQTIDLLAFGSRLVTAGLLLLWATGIGLLAFYYFVSPAALQNPKLIAKVAAVCALTLNGMALHRIVLPMVQDRINRPVLAGLRLSNALPVIAIGMTSGVSWVFCCVLGVVKQLNGTVPAPVLLGSYLAAIALGVAVASAGHLLLTQRPRRARAF